MAGFGAQGTALGGIRQAWQALGGAALAAAARLTRQGGLPNSSAGSSHCHAASRPASRARARRAAAAGAAHPGAHHAWPSAGRRTAMPRNQLRRQQLGCSALLAAAATRMLLRRLADGVVRHLHTGMAANLVDSLG